MTTHVSIEELQKFIDKDVVLHVHQSDGSVAERTGVIKQATVAGVPFKEKGKPNLDLLTAEQIYEVGLAPAKAKPVTQKAINPIELGQARQHLLDRHGVELSWGKEADEKQAFDYHAGLDHSNLGHRHYTEDELKEKQAKKDKREQELADSDA